MAGEASQYVFRFLYESVGAQRTIADAEKAKRAAKDFAVGVEGIGRKTKGAAENTRKAWQEMGNFERSMRRVLITMPIWWAFRQAFMGVVNAFRDGVRFMVDWEYQMAQVAIVGGGASEELRGLSDTALALAKEFGVGFADMGMAMRLWITQGRSVQETMELLPTTIKMAMITGRNLSDTVEDLTAILKSYNIEAEKSIGIVDKLISVELKHAITTAHLAEGLRRLAPVTAGFNMSLEETMGVLTAVHVVTRRAGQTVGDALKTIFSRMIVGSEQAIQSIARIPVFLDAAGKSTFEYTNQQRELSEVLFELSVVWHTLNETQRAQLALELAGRRRLTEVMALFGNYEEVIIATAHAMLGAGKSLEAVGILQDTVRHKTLMVAGAWHELFETFREPALAGAKHGLTAVQKVLEGLVWVIDPVKHRYAGLRKEIRENIDENAKVEHSVEGILKVYEYLQARQRSLTELIRHGIITTEHAATVNASLAKIFQERLNPVLKEIGMTFQVEGNTIEQVVSRINENLKEIFGREIEATLKGRISSLRLELTALQEMMEKAIGRPRGALWTPAPIPTPMDLPEPLLVEALRQRGRTEEDINRALETRRRIKEKEVSILETENKLKSLGADLERATTEAIEAYNASLKRREGGTRTVAEFLEDIKDLEMELELKGASRLEIIDKQIERIREYAVSQHLLLEQEDEILDKQLGREYERLKLQRIRIVNQQQEQQYKINEEIILERLEQAGATQIELAKEGLRLKKESGLFSKEELDLEGKRVDLLILRESFAKRLNEYSIEEEILLEKAKRHITDEVELAELSLKLKEQSKLFSRDELDLEEKRLELIREQQKTRLEEIKVRTEDVVYGEKLKQIYLSEIKVQQEFVEYLKKSGRDILTIAEEEAKIKEMAAKNETERIRIVREAEEEIYLSRLRAMGFTDVDIQIQKIGLLKQRGEDYNKVLQEEYKLHKMITDEVTKYSETLQVTFRDAIKEMLTGETDIKGFFERISTAWRESLIDSLAEVFTQQIFQMTGVGDIFGQLMVGLRTAGNPLLKGFYEGSNITYMAIVKGFRDGAGLLQGIPATGIGGTPGAAGAGIPGFFGGDGRARPAGGMGAIGLGLNVLMAGYGGFQAGGVAGGVLGAGGALATALGFPVIGAGLGLLSLLLGRRGRQEVRQRETDWRPEQARDLLPYLGIEAPGLPRTIYPLPTSTYFVSNIHIRIDRIEGERRDIADTIAKEVDSQLSESFQQKYLRNILRGVAPKGISF